MRHGSAWGSGMLLDALEPRQLMAVDLTGAFAPVPVTASNGTRQAITFTLENQGDTRSRGAVGVDFYAILAGATFSTSTATPLGRFTRSAALDANGGTRNFTVSVPLSAALVAGDYQVVAVIDPTNRIAESNESNNIVTSGAITVTQANFDLTPAFATRLSFPSTVTTGRTTSAVMRVTLSNSSSSTVNVPAGQSVNVQVVARPVGAVDDSTDVVLNQSPVNAFVGGIQPGGSRTVVVPVQFPTTLTAGNYNILAEVDTQGTLPEINETNNDVMLNTPVSVLTASATTVGSVGTGTQRTPTSVTVLGQPVGTVATQVSGVAGTPVVTTTTTSTSTFGNTGLGVTPISAIGNTLTNDLGLTLDSGSGFSDLTPTGLNLTPTASIGVTPVNSASSGGAIIGGATGNPFLNTTSTINPFVTTTATTNPFLTTITTSPPLTTGISPLRVTSGENSLLTSSSDALGSVMF